MKMNKIVRIFALYFKIKKNLFFKDINRLNSALESEYKTEIQFEYVAPPIADTVNDTPSQNQTKEDAQVPLHIQNETTSSPSTSIQTPTEQTQRTSGGLSSTKAPSSIDTSKPVPILDEKSNLKVVSDEIIPPVQIKINEQQPKDATQQNIIKEDISLVHKETISSTQSHKQEEALNVLKPIVGRVLPASNQQQQISNTTINNKLQDNSSVDVKPSSPTPLQSNQSHQPISDSIQNVDSLGVKSDQQQKPSEPTQINRSSDLKLDQQQQQQQKTSEPAQINPSSNLKLEQQQQKKPSEPAQINPSSNLKLEQQQQKPPEPVQINRSSDLKLEQQQQQQKPSDPVQINPSSNLKLEQQQQQQQPSGTIQNISSLDSILSPPTPIKTDQEQQISNSTQNVNSKEQQQQIPNTIQNTNSIDKNTSSIVENQQPKVIDTLKPIETVPIGGKSDDILSITKESPTLVQTPPPAPRVLRSATSRIQAKTHAHHRHVHSKEHDHSNEHDHSKEDDLEKISITGKINFLSFNLSISFLRKCSY
jgi:hypothetical protein